VSISGEPFSLGAFNLDLVFPQDAVSVQELAANLDDLNVEGREFSCSLGSSGSDLEPDPAIGRLRVVCFSFGGEAAPAPQAPTVLARFELTALHAGSVEIRLENVAVFTPDATGVTIGASPLTVIVE
jgi:hypothetical protein